MKIKKLFFTIGVFFVILISLSSNVLALTDLQMKAADLNWDGVVDEKDLDLLVHIGYPDRPEDGIESPNGNYLNLSSTSSQSSSSSGTLIGLAFTQLHENGAMWIFCYGNEASCKSNTAKSYLNNYRASYYIYDYIDEAKEYYYPRGDGTSNGSLNYGYGVLVKMNGTYYNVDNYAKYGVDIKSKINSLSNVSVEITDNVSRDAWLSKREEVINTIEDLGYSESDFESYQIDCLADFRYQGYYASPVIKAYMQNGKQCNSAVRASSGGFSYGSRGDDRWTLFSQGIYQWSGSGTVHYLLNENDFTSGDANASSLQQSIADVAKNSRAYGIVPQSGYCLKWVFDVYRAAGLSNASLISYNCARCQGYHNGVSNDFSNVPLGACIFTQGGHSTYGHVRHICR